MKGKEIQGYISKAGTYSVECPACLRSKTYRLADLPPGQPNPFGYTCDCGARTPVRLVGMRHGHRKRVQLAASVQRTTGTGGLPVIATVEDISISGARLKTERLRDLNKDEILKFTCVLDDPSRTKLVLQARVRRIAAVGTHRVLAIEYVRLTQEQHERLDVYLAT